MVIDYTWVSHVLTSGVVSLVLTMWIELGMVVSRRYVECCYQKGHPGASEKTAVIDKALLSFQSKATFPIRMTGNSDMLPKELGNLS